MISNIALIVPTPVESHELRHKIHPEPGEDLRLVYEGESYGKNIIFTHCGVGKVNAAYMTTLILENYDIDCVILFGIGGAYGHSGLGIGHIAVAESENYAEEGVLIRDGWRSMEFTGFPLLKNKVEYYNTFPMDKDLTQVVIEILKKSCLPVSSGNFITVSQCSGTSEIGEILEKRFKGICENTEGAAVAHICALYGKPMVEVRGISNIIEDRDTKKWDIPLAVLNGSSAVIELLNGLK